jgi:hypothetical protein
MSEDADKLAAMCATPLEIQCNGKSYRLSPLSLDQFSRMKKWAKQQPFIDLQEKLTAIKDKRLREKAETQMLTEAIANSNSDTYIANMMSSDEAIPLLFKLMLSAEHPDIQEKEIDEILSIRGLLQIRKWCESLIGLDEEARKNSSAGEGTAMPLPPAGPQSSVA